MSYSLIGHFVDVDNKKVMLSADVSFLKNINTTRYSNKFEKIMPSGKSIDSDYPEITTYTYADFENYYSKSILNDPEISNSFAHYEANGGYSNPADMYIVDSDFFNVNKDVFEKYLVSPPNGFPNADFIANNISIYVRKCDKNCGNWFKESDFEKFLPDFENEYKSKEKQYNYLQSMRNSKDWFEMSETGRNNLLDEISVVGEDLEDAKWKYFSVLKFLNIIEFLRTDVCEMQKDCNGCTNHLWNVNENHEIEIYIYAI